MSKLLERLKAAEAQRQRVLAEGKPVDAGSPASGREQQERALLEQEQARFESASAGAKRAVEYARAEKNAAQLAAARAEKEKLALAAARVRAAAEADALKRAREREAAEAAALQAIESRAAVDAEAARLATERRAAESSAARAAKERQRAEQRAQSRPSSPAKWQLAGIGAVIVIGVTVALFLFESNTDKSASTRVAPPAGRLQLKLDRDVETFAARVTQRKL